MHELRDQEAESMLFDLRAIKAQELPPQVLFDLAHYTETGQYRDVINYNDQKQRESMVLQGDITQTLDHHHVTGTQSMFNGD